MLDEATYWQMKQRKVPVQEILASSGASCDVSQYRRIRNSLIERRDYLWHDQIWEPLVSVYGRLFAVQPAALVTLRSNREALEEQLTRLGIVGWFESVLSGPASTSERWKTKVGFIESAFGPGTIDAGENIFFGDTETDIRAGKALGMKTAAVSFGIRDRELLAPEGPDFIFDSPAELAEFISDQLLEGNGAPTAQPGMAIQ
jgi:phosphoglycolate phosphatase-like HAD superfamily hydrolase